METVDSSEAFRNMMMENAKVQKSFFDLVMTKNWKEVIKYFEERKVKPSTRLTKSNETALHVAVMSLQDDDKMDRSITEMVRVCEEYLDLKNNNGDTPLHLAAAAGSEKICRKIVEKDPNVIKIRNKKGETPLFVAAYHGKHSAFLALHEACQGHEILALCRRNKDGNNILHSAIKGEFFRLAYWIIQNPTYESLSSKMNVNGETPLHLLARKPDLFRSSCNMGLIERTIYYCVLIEEMKSTDCFLDSRNTTNSTSDDLNYPPHYQTCVNAYSLFKTLTNTILPGGNQSGSRNDVEATPTKCPGEVIKHEDFFPAHYATCIFSFYFLLKIILTILGLGYWRIDRIKNQKSKHTYAKQVMTKLVKSTFIYQHEFDGQRPNSDDRDGSLDSTKDEGDGVDSLFFHGLTLPPELTGGCEEKKHQATPLLVAAKHGILEIVEEIVRSFPISIHDVDSLGKSVLLVAAEDRQPQVLRFLLQRNLPDYLFHHVDEHGNGILNLGAMLHKDFLPWELPGVALQMQSEISWYKHLMAEVPPTACIAHKNQKGDTPSMIFTETHSDLVSKGAEWLRKTSESCSVVAALIAGVAFATAASTVSTVYPYSEVGRMEFNGFTVSSLAALGLSVTALLCFLAIITSRFEESDFKSSLPLKLMSGLSCLFISIIAILFCFCFGHSLNLGDVIRTAVWPIYLTMIIPVLIFLYAQLPLYADLVWAKMSSLPQRNYKVFAGQFSKPSPRETEKNDPFTQPKTILK